MIFLSSLRTQKLEAKQKSKIKITKQKCYVVRVGITQSGPWIFWKRACEQNSCIHLVVVQNLQMLCCSELKFMSRVSVVCRVAAALQLCHLFINHRVLCIAVNGQMLVCMPCVYNAAQKTKLNVKIIIKQVYHEFSNCAVNYDRNLSWLMCKIMHRVK